MTIIGLVPLLVMLLGLIMYFATADGKKQEIGRICFEVGLFVTLIRLGGSIITLMK
jgi:hypothetical protein